MKKTLFLLLLACGIAGAQAQIPAEVTDIMGKCRAAMTHATGLEYEMDMKAGVGPLAMKMHLVVGNKGDLERALVITKIMGIEVSSEKGFDGTDSWEVNHSDKADTITFTRGKVKEKSNSNLELYPEKQYNKAKLKQKDGYYEITFSEPKDKSSEVKNITFKVSDKNHVLREIHSSARGAKVTMTITRIRVGLKDSYFKLDTTKYPGAVIIRK